MDPLEIQGAARNLRDYAIASYALKDCPSCHGSGVPGMQIEAGYVDDTFMCPCVVEGMKKDPNVMFATVGENERIH